MLSNLHRWNPALQLGCRVVRTRYLSVLSWGRNREGQCGLAGTDVVAEPTEVPGLQDADIRSLVAGKLASGAVTSTGDALTWGDGRSGKLGHGNGSDVSIPSRVEALVGCARVQQIALGDSHTLLLDNRGGVWACGENKEGQLGLGTPVEVIADQHRQAFYQSAGPLLSERQGGAPEPPGPGTRGLLSQHPSRQAPPSSSRPSDTFPWLRDANRPGEGAALFDELREQRRQRAAEDRLAADVLLYGSLRAAEEAAGLQPGQLRSPARVGLDRHPLGRLRHPSSVIPPRSGDDMLRGLEDERVLGLAASSYFSAAVTAAGEVWTFGACFNGSLGGEVNWSTSAMCVHDPLASVIADNGGAVAVAAGSTFCAALTAMGRVVVWGKLPVPAADCAPSAERGPMAPLGQLGGRLTAARLSMPAEHARVRAAVVEGLPPVRQMAAGRHHLLMSDGETVWGIGRWMDEAGEESGGAPLVRPKELLRLPSEGVASLHCGPHCSGVVTGEGRLWMWGRLFDEEDASYLLKQRSGYWSAEGGNAGPGLDAVDWSWPGFGATRPSQVQELSGVRGLALGGWHALVLVE